MSRCRSCLTFRTLPGRTAADHHTAGIIMAPSLAYMDQAYLDAKADGWSKRPIVEMLIPSTLDDTLAPKGQHVASLFCQHVAPTLPNDASWDTHREEVADVMIDLVNSHAPNFKASVLGRQIMSPLDLERTFGLIGGDIFHGALSLDQLFSARPMLGHGDYRGPLRRAVHVRLGNASRRRRHRSAGTQCRTGNHRRFSPRTPETDISAPRTAAYFLHGSGYENGSVTAGCVGNFLRGSGLSLFAAAISTVARTTEACRKSSGRK